MKPLRLRDLKGIGPRSEGQLAMVCITSPETLRTIGAVGAYERLVRAGAPVSLNMLWALEGALSDRHWREVARDDRTALLAELDRRGIAP
jgi:DNA transformation protein